jgi:predicted PolB exonuclease-like 3'-5' exonuclease
MDVLSDFGASRAVKLDEVSRAGKFGIDGSQVKPLYDEGRIDEIRNYCEIDVLNTYLVYPRYKLHTGGLTQDAYNQAISDVIAMIDAEKGERPHFQEFVEAWGQACGNAFLLS